MNNYQILPQNYLNFNESSNKKIYIKIFRKLVFKKYFVDIL